MKCVNDKVLKYFYKASAEQKIQMIRTLREQINNLNILLLTMEKELNK